MPVRASSAGGGRRLAGRRDEEGSQEELEGSAAEATSCTATSPESPEFAHRMARSDCGLLHFEGGICSAGGGGAHAPRVRLLSSAGPLFFSPLLARIGRHLRAISGM